MSPFHPFLAFLTTPEDGIASGPLEKASGRPYQALIQRERQVPGVECLVGAVGHHLADGLVEGLAQLGVLAAQPRRDADAQRLGVLDVLSHELAALALRLLRRGIELQDRANARPKDSVPLVGVGGRTVAINS